MAARVGRNLVLLWTLRGANTHLCGGRNPVHPLLHDRQSAVDRKTYSLSLYRNLCMKPDQRLESTTGQQHTCRENMFTSLVSMGFTDTQVEQLARRTLNKCTDQTVIQRLATLSTLVTLGFSPSSLLKILNMCPELYQVKGALLQQRVDNLRKLGLLEGSLQRVVSHYPKILTVPIKRVTGMSRFLREKCLLSAQQVTDVLRDSPAIVLEDTSRLEYRFQYAYFRMGIQQEEMVKSGLFRVSTEEVRCRHSFLERRGLYQTPDKKGQTRIANPKLKDFLTIPEDTFLSQVALATQEEFEVFRKLMEREVQEEEGLESSDSEEEDEEDDESENRGKEGYKRRRK